MTAPRVLRPLGGGLDDYTKMRDRRIGETTEADARAARRDADRVVSWGRMTFYRCRERGIIVRDGDVNAGGGWQYATRGALDLDWAEIEQVAVKLAAVGEAEIWTPAGSDEP